MKKLLPLAILVTSCAPSSSIGILPDRAMPICSVLAHASEQNGRAIFVKGIYRHTPHGGLFFGRECNGDFVRLRNAPTYVPNPKAETDLQSALGRDNSRAIDVSYRAVFHVLPTLQCAESYCFRFQLEVIELVSADAE